jgi:hypothetical protein
MKARCAFKRRAASCAKEVNVVFGLLWAFALIGVVSKAEFEMSEVAEAETLNESTEEK